ncbi:hypothetical protein F503_02747 [Ophiostoma piceae UAMH 11346]|uniref:Uncharacterized protein n=1 Tax=Ophiostoma piceae (strain UAMH 11346) TaxID=1262450 RepID=S3BZC4_OPHP1|nr:hypothetical protein F503_02747 [Ophiostoma piceae UAMH 11346]
MESPKPEFHVPGAYHFDNLALNGHRSLPVRALGADVFLPPADLARSTGSLFSDMSITTSATNNHEYASMTAKRKRPAQDFSRESTPVAGEYTLAGQIDVDGTQSSQGMDESAYYSDVEYRRQLGPSQDSHISHTHLAHDGVVGPGGEKWTVLHALGNVVGKVWDFCTAGAFRGFHAGGGDGYDWETGKPTDQHQQATKAPTGIIFSNAAHETEEDPSLKFELSPTGPSPLAMGGFTADGERITTTYTYAPDRKESSGTPPPRRNGKRRQVGPFGDELNRNWVMVDTSQRGGASRQASRASSSATMKNPLMARSRTPDRRSSQYRTSKSSTVTPGTATSSRRISTPISRLGPGTPSTSTAQGRRQQRVSHAGSPSLSTREPASFASPRATTPLGSRRATMAGGFQTSCSPGGGSRIPVPSTEQTQNPFSRMSSASRPSSSLEHRSSSSLSSSPGHRRSYSAKVGSDAIGREGRQKSPKKIGALGSFEESPRLTEEAKRLAARKMVAERDADAKMEALNYQLQQMIRQGREALGTTFEVDVGDGDEGEEGDEYWADDL